MDCCVAVGEGSGGVFREPCSFPRCLEGDVQDGGTLVFRVYSGELLWCEATADVLAKLFCCEVVCLKLVSIVYCFM